MIRSLRYRFRGVNIKVIALTVAIVFGIILFVTQPPARSSKEAIRSDTSKVKKVAVESKTRVLPHAELPTKDKSDGVKLSQPSKISADQQQQILAHADNSANNERKFPGHRVVHLDLKGAPPKMAYYKKLFPFLRSVGATGVLIEYEDMFPYKGNLKILARTDAYTENEVNAIVQLAEEFKLMVIPLIQTFGHLEFMLKHKQFKHLRAINSSKRALCPCQNSSLPILLDMAKQVIALHPNIKYLHVGGDEIYDLMKCSKCKKLPYKSHDMYLLHMVPLLSEIKATWPELNVLMWDDMLRKWSLDQMLTLQTFATPMVWAYEENLSQYFPQAMWKNYKQVFGSVWIASAFKGALREDTDIVPLNKHIENHVQWLKIISNLDGMEIPGIAITGWSRFDHFAPLCELLPAGLPSLALCLTVLDRGNVNPEVIHTVSVDALGCAGKIYDDSSGSYQVQKCGFPGSDVFLIVSRLNLLRNEAKSFHTQMKILAQKGNKNEHVAKVKDMHARVLQLKADAESSFDEVYTKPVANAWIEEKLGPVLKLAEQVVKIGNS